MQPEDRETVSTLLQSKERGWNDCVRLMLAHDLGEVLLFLSCRCIHRKQDNNISIVNGNRSKSAFLPLAHARVSIVAQGDGFQD